VKNHLAHRSLLLLSAALLLLALPRAQAADIDVYQATGARLKVTPTGVTISPGGLFGLASGIRMPDLGFIADANGNELLILDTTTSAVNEFTLANAATGTPPKLSATGGDTNIGITLEGKGTGVITLKSGGTNGVVADMSGVAGGNFVVASASNTTVSLNEGGTIHWQFFSNTGSFGLWDASSAAIAFNVSGSNQNVAIGSLSAATEKLEVTGNILGSGTLKVGGGSTVAKFITATTTWDPASLANGASEKKSAVTMTGVAVGDVCSAALTTIVSSDWAVQACVTSANTVEVKITNNTGGVVDLASGTLRINCVKY
jgi:hypothetical protein